jgi:TIR domain-containing protein
MRLIQPKSVPNIILQHVRSRDILLLGLMLPSPEARAILRKVATMWKGEASQERGRTIVVQDSSSQRRASSEAEDLVSSTMVKGWGEVYDEDLNRFARILGEMTSSLVYKAKRYLESGIQSTPPKIFISYASEDEQYARSVYNALKAQGFEPWLDKEDLVPGIDWDRNIKENLRTADFLVLCLTHQAINKRGYVQKELRMALDTAEEVPIGSIFLIPVRFDKCTVPRELSRYHYVDWFSPNGPDKVVYAIHDAWRRRNVQDEVDELG